MLLVCGEYRKQCNYNKSEIDIYNAIGDTVAVMMCYIVAPGHLYGFLWLYEYGMKCLFNPHHCHSNFTNVSD